MEDRRMPRTTESEETIARLESELAKKSAELTAIQQKLLLEIADLKMAYETANEDMSLYRAIVDSAQDLVFSKDRDLRYTLVNPAMERLHGRAASEMIGRRAEDLMSKEAAARIREVDLRVLGGQIVEEEYITPIKGVRLTFHGIRAPLRDVSGDIVGMCGIVRNVTESRKAAFTGDKGSIKIDYPSKAMRAMLKQGSRALTTDGTVLLLGESGSGKDRLARWIHEHSHRANGPYFAINCAAVPKELAESELFGHEAGAFTGARGAKRGLLQLAEGGTLLLNEIGELTLFLQSKLLTFLDTKSFLRVGGERSVHVNARIIAATHRDLATEIQAGRFLAALFYRLNVYTIQVPPLRERLDDIPTLARKMIPEIAAEMQLTRIPEIDDSALNALRSYHWPGNVREFRNVIERSLMLWDEGYFTVALPLREARPESWSYHVSFPADRSLHDLTDEVAQSVVREALRRSGGKRAEAARLLRVSRGALYRYMKGFGITRENGTPS